MIGTLIGKGNTADVFDMGTNKVIKLFKIGYPLDSVRKEFENSKLLNVIDIPIVKSHELITYNGRYGIVYDKIDGRSMQDLLLETCELEKYATSLAILHKGIISHRLKADNLKSILTRNIEHTNELSLLCKSKLISILDELPDGDGFCHGDFHFGNVIVSQGKNYIIDYMNVCSGHEYGDIARTVYLIEMTPVPAEVVDVGQFLQMKKYITDIYLKEMGVSRESLSYWLMIIAAARLSELSNEQNDERNTVFEFLSKYGF
jgi:hypothetical protein